MGTTTAWRYVEEVVSLLATRAPEFGKAVRDAKKAGYAYVILNCTLISMDRVAAGVITLADKGYQGSTYAKIPYRGENKPESQNQANRAHAKLRSSGERANAQLKNQCHLA